VDAMDVSRSDDGQDQDPHRLAAAQVFSLCPRCAMFADVASKVFTPNCDGEQPTTRSLSWNSRSKP
jgi:hypothetical protein